MADKSNILERFLELDKSVKNRRHEGIVASNRAISLEVNPLYRAIEQECELTGHEWKFDHFNWDGSYQWDKCKWCGKAEGADRHTQVKT